MVAFQSVDGGRMERGLWRDLNSERYQKKCPTYLIQHTFFLLQHKPLVFGAPPHYPTSVGHSLRTVQYMPSFSVPCSCVCARLTSPIKRNKINKLRCLQREKLCHQVNNNKSYCCTSKHIHYSLIWTFPDFLLFLYLI